MGNFRSTTLLAFFLFSFSTLFGQTDQEYVWKNVKVGGGGLIPGIVFSQAEENLLYARTDVGGAYRWNPDDRTWIPLNDDISDFNYLGVVSLAADPVDADRVYLATGLYYQDWWGTNGAIYRSADRGESWQVTHLPFKLGGNTPGRASGERLQVDPNSNNILFLGTNLNGLWKSTNHGATWARVNSFPANRITFVALDKTTGTAGNPTPTMYVGVCDHMYTNTFSPSIYRSTDGGTTWALIPGQPTNVPPKDWEGGADRLMVPNRMAFAGENIYFSYSNSIAPNGDYEFPNSITHGAVYRFNKAGGTWTNITPDANLQGGYGGICVHPSNPDIVLTTTLGRWWPQNEVYISTNGGTNWQTVLYANTWSHDVKATLDHSKSPYAATHHPHWMGDIQINPFNPNNAIFGTGYGMYATYNLNQAFTNNPTAWVFENEGLEETVPLEMVSPPTGAPLVNAIGDFGGFRHNDLEVSPPAGAFDPDQGTNPSLAFAENAPDIMVRTHQNGARKGSYSLNGGSTWTMFAAQPAGTNAGGQIAVSANGNRIVWAPGGGAVSYSTNNGGAWTASTGIPANLKPVADRVNNNTFYALNVVTGRVYRSTNGGVSFDIVNTTFPTLPGYNAGSGKIVAVFGQEGHVWATARQHGLYFSTNGGTSFTQIAGVQVAHNVTFGKSASEEAYPTVFVDGQIGGKRGLFRSDDMGTTWVGINDESQQYGGSYRTIAGDRNIYGRLYIGTEGRGALFGDIADPMPLELLSFSGNHENDKIVLSWQTTEEQNVKEFRVYRSSDPVDVTWEYVGSKAAGNTSGINNYTSYDDLLPEFSPVYYKLVIEDFDGTMSTSNIISVHLENVLSILVSPNPSDYNFLLRIVDKAASYNLRVYDLMGRTVEEQTDLKGREVTIGENFPAGVYFVEITTEQISKVVKIIKE
ncbi:MAG: T9SS type A sorting domain-containing protein [Cytophagaceae bacterium]